MLNFLKRLFNDPTTEPAKPKYKGGSEKPPSKRQITECEVLGLKIKPSMNSRDVWQRLNDALTNPQNQALLDKHYAPENALHEDEEREEYGNALINERNKWEDICHPTVHYLVTYKKGKILRSDVVEFDTADIEDAQKPYVKIEALLPKMRKPRDEDPYLEWEKETSFRPKQILEIKKFSSQIDMHEVDRYEQLLNKAKEIKAKYS